MKTLPAMTHHAVIQIGHAIFGVGETEADAIEDAREWVDDGDNLEDALAVPHAAVVGDMIVVECSKALHDKVKADGTVLYEELGRDAICLPSEIDDDE